jgi:hypothetical protein
VKALSDRIADFERDINLYIHNAKGRSSKVEEELRLAVESIARAKEENLSPYRSESAEAALKEAEHHLQSARDSWPITVLRIARHHEKG